MPNHLDRINEPKPALNLVSRSIQCLHLRTDDSEAKNSYQAVNQGPNWPTRFVILTCQRIGRGIGSLSVNAIQL